MSEEVVIPFRTRALDAAKARAREILGLAKEAAKEIKDKLERKTFLADARAQAKATIGQAKDRLRLADASRAKTFEATSKATINRAFGRVNEVREKAGAIFGAVSDFRVGGGITALAGLSGFGPAGAAAAAIAGLVLPLIQKQVEERQKNEARALLSRVEDRLRETDYAARLRTDAAFRRLEDVRTRASYLREREEGRGWHPRSARFAEVT